LPYRGQTGQHHRGDDRPPFTPIGWTVSAALCRQSGANVNPRRLQRISVQVSERIAGGTSSEVFVLIDIPVDFDRLMPARRRWPSGQSNCCSDLFLSLGSCGFLHAQRTADVLRLHEWIGVRMGRFSQSLHSAGLDHCAVNGVCQIESFGQAVEAASAEVATKSSIHDEAF
jgi:hypothetical protein